MTYHVGEQIGDGGYGNVYKGRDDALDRDVAIKFIHTSAGGEEFAKEQAKALSRCSCENVVTVYSLEELEDPSTKSTKLALVMELVPGETVLTRLSKATISLDEVRRIGFGTINGLDHIHNAGIVHRDLSLDNVMASSTSVKIIDILYEYTLAGGDAGTRDRLRLDDRNSLRDLLTKLIRSVNPAQADVFTKSLTPDSTLAGIRTAFDAATDPKLIVDIPKLVEHFLRLINEDAYEDSDDYALAISEEIQDAVVIPLLEAMISNGGAPKKRTRILDLLWNRLNFNGRKIIGAKLSEAITREVPNGSWVAYFRMLNAFGKTGWLSLTKMCRMRLERALVEDVKKGYLNTYGIGEHRGQFGTWSTLFYPFFNKPEALLDAIVPLLHGNWYTQNYVGENFMRFLPRLVKKPEDRQRLIDGLAAAVKNKAFKIKISNLPEEWRDDVDAKVKAKPTEEPPPATEAKPSDPDAPK